MTDVATSRLIVPGLGGIYRLFAPYTSTLLRIVAGLSFVPHGYPKLFVNPARSAAFLEESGFEPGMLWAILLGSTEFFGGLLLAAGFLTRLACIPLFIFLLTAITHHWPNGFSWIDEGFEYPLFWAIVIFHFLIHGAGRYSVDGMLGREV